ncbi:hypothetical protein [Mangrovihabitans endophyticus]|uniref:Uncharacterized protein n=1 Tax=Mangrovihabitans endophyticus TaxID=1751298 RepID=A0A8J3BZZ5_9ACTN|nr:hypothetical protein [Mangrovihabitans endophyticus]GGK91156.1 hypothetical protein GCM10012284_26230 [Mangrovihabitans endophyticus]
MRPRRLLAVVATVLAGVFAAPVPASAIVINDLWSWPVVCTEVEFGDYAMTRLDALEIDVHLRATVRPCAGSDGAQGRWALAAYRPAGGLAWRAQPYATEPTGTPLAVDGPAPYGTWAVCVLNYISPVRDTPNQGLGSRVACIGMGEVDGVEAAVRVSPADTRFTGATLTVLTDFPTPFCSTCV